MRITSCVRRLEAYVPGEQPSSPNVVKLNTNENAYPPSPACADALKAFDWARLRRYPDPNSTALREAIAEKFGTTPKRVFIGNGSDEILSLAARAFVEPDEAIASLDPSYSLYKTLAAIRDVPWTSDRTRKDVSLFLWTNPNAPTGTLASKDEIAAFARAFPGVVLVDEAYADFARWNCLDLATAPGNENVIVMRTFSKGYSLAGLRVGYCIGPEPLIDALVKVKDSYNVDALAQTLALAALEDEAYHEKTVRSIIETRDAFSDALRSRGWDVLPSDANFIFAKPPAPQTAAALFSALRAKEIYVRYFPAPLTADRIRITIGTPEQMDTLLQALDSLA